MNLSLKRLPHGSRVKSHELRHEPGLIELGASPFLNSLNAFVSCQKMMEWASKKESFDMDCSQ